MHGKTKHKCGFGRNYEHCVNIPKHLRAWLAALIDGEGTIGLDIGRGRCSSFVLNPDIRIYNNHRGLIEKCRMVAGCGIVTKSGKKLWRWILRGRAMFHFLKQIAPYLIIKREQASWVLFVSKRQRGRQGRERDFGELCMLAVLKHAIAQLNANGSEWHTRGPMVPPPKGIFVPIEPAMWNTKTRSAWIAGLIDGEGCINFSGSRGMPGIHVANSERNILAVFRRFTESTLCGPYRGNRGGKPMYCASLRGRKAVRLLKLIKSFLIVKRNKAEIAVCWIYVGKSRGEDNPCSTITNRTASIIKTLAEIGCRPVDIMAACRVSRSIVEPICIGRAWRRISPMKQTCRIIKEYRKKCHKNHENWLRLQSKRLRKAALARWHATREDAPVQVP